MLSKTPPVPKYYQLARTLSEQIAAGSLKLNDQLPTEEMLCDMYGVSRGTVREAVRLLQEEGLIRRERGRGTFVTARRQSSTLFTLVPFSETMRRQNRVPSTRVLSATTTPATANLHRLGDTWNDQYAVAVKSWEKSWDDLTTFFDCPADIRRIIYPTNTVEAYHRQIRRVTKTKSSFPTPEVARKLLYLATVYIERKWTRPIWNWPQVLNQLGIRFEDRIEY